MKIISLEHVPSYQSQGLGLGVWTFTTFLSNESHYVFLNEHLNRLLKGAEFLFPQEKWGEKRVEIEQFLKREFVPSHYFRLSIALDTLLLNKKPHAPKPELLSLGNATSIKAPSLLPAYVKNPNYLVAEMELREAQKNHYDDVVFFDEKANVTEASTSNIFVCADEKTILTPKLSSMVLAGVTRQKLIECLKKEGLTIRECDISKGQLESSKEIWLTNAIQGIRQVRQYEAVSFKTEGTLYQKICGKFGRFGENFYHE